MTKADELKVAMNIVSRVGLSGDLMGEFSKAMSAINGFNSQEQMTNMQNMAQNTPVAPPQSTGETISPDMGNNTIQDPNALNQSPQPPMGGKYDNL